MAVINIKMDLALNAMNQDNLDMTLGNSIYGYNTDFNKRYLHPSRNNQGMVFFVRPQLNLSEENVRYQRSLWGSMGSSDDISIPTFVRHTLDPRLAASSKVKVINNRQAYIPLLTNALISLSGFPSVELPSTTSEEGRLGETYTLPDGSTDILGGVDISASFGDTAGEPVLNLFHTWITATSLMIKGKIRPYADFIAEHERCFDTRIFRVVLDQTGKYLRKIVATGPGFIDSIDMGKGFDYTREQHYVEGDETTSMRFKMAGVEYKDPILIYEFNKIGEIFQPLLKDEHRDDAMVIIPQEQQHLYKYLGYPYIDIDTMSFDYWVERHVFEEIQSKYADLARDVMTVSLPANNADNDYHSYEEDEDEQ